jgi:diacylglycerol kinase family enzyme
MHTDYPDLIETDGELIGHTPVKITVIPKALRFVVNKEPVIGW